MWNQGFAGKKYFMLLTNVIVPMLILSADSISEMQPEDLQQ